MGEMKMEDYLVKMKSLADVLKLAGNPISNPDLIIQTLNCLDSEYNHIVVKLFDQTTLSSTISFESRSESSKQGNHNAFLVSQNSTQDYDWYFNSGASNHVTHQTYKFQDMTEHHGTSSSNTPIPIGNHSDIEQEPDDHDEPVNSYSRLEDNNGQATNDSISNTEQTSLDEPDDHDEPTASTIPLESNSGVIHSRNWATSVDDKKIYGRVMADLAAEIAWTRSLIDELKLPLPRKPAIWCDNLSAKKLASNPVIHAISKHIEIDVHYIRDQVLQNKVIVAYVPSAHQIVDFLTNDLTHTSFNMLKDKLGVVPLPTSLRGEVRNKIT
ncbi:hypothetical protein KIW84_071073 [Lathyrus oleraceus]|uniref:Uncharacterized protein n=1 Tax=Pisum sativum TaxID=3888 RepID=A0A9D4ZVE8_PEA|nr:hypothetical protein KIW84_071073 [Pisum sativum]